MTAINKIKSVVPTATLTSTKAASEKELGQKFDSGKLRFDLVPPEFEEAIADVLTYGADKYAPNSWQHVDNAKNRYYAALRRHINAWRKGEKIDKESKKPHLAHAACNLLFLMHFDEEEEKDVRSE